MISNPTPGCISGESYKNSYMSPVFTVAVFIIAKTQKQPKCLSRDERIGKIIDIHNGILLSHKKKERNAICSNMMDLVIIILSEVSQTETNTYNITYMWNLKNNTNKLTKQKQMHRCREKACACPGQESGREGLEV